MVADLFSHHCRSVTRCLLAVGLAALCICTFAASRADANPV